MRRFNIEFFLFDKHSFSCSMLNFILDFPYHPWYNKDSRKTNNEKERGCTSCQKQFFPTKISVVTWWQVLCHLNVAAKSGYSISAMASLPHGWLPINGRSSMGSCTGWMTVQRGIIRVTPRLWKISMSGAGNTNFNSKPERGLSPVLFYVRFLILKHSIYNNQFMEIML